MIYTKNAVKKLQSELVAAKIAEGYVIDASYQVNDFAEIRLAKRNKPRLVIGISEYNSFSDSSRSILGDEAFDNNRDGIRVEIRDIDSSVSGEVIVFASETMLETRVGNYDIYATSYAELINVEAKRKQRIDASDYHIVNANTFSIPGELFIKLIHPRYSNAVAKAVKATDKIDLTVEIRPRSKNMTTASNVPAYWSDNVRQHMAMD